jgi:ParB-like chromosome segregation protein Spo0J
LIDFHPENRVIDETSDTFLELLDSVRLLGVVNPPQIQQCTGGRYLMHDGERRIRSARLAKLDNVECDIWPEATSRDVILASIALQTNHDPHRAIHVARRLRDTKNEFGLTLEQLAQRTSIPLHRINTYLSLMKAGDDLLVFFREVDIPVSIASAMVRYQRDTNEARTRSLIERYRSRPMTREEILALRKRDSDAAGDRGDEAEPADDRRDPRSEPVLSRRFETVFRKDPAAALPRLTAVLEQLGYRLVPLTTPPKKLPEANKA